MTKQEGVEEAISKVAASEKRINEHLGQIIKAVAEIRTPAFRPQSLESALDAVIQATRDLRYGLDLQAEEVWNDRDDYALVKSVSYLVENIEATLQEKHDLFRDWDEELASRRTRNRAS